MLYDNQADIKTPFICAPISLTDGDNTYPNSEYDLGKWVFPAVASRANLRKDFATDKEISRAIVELQCNNKIDFYINGTLIESSKSADGRYLTGVTDITEHVVVGNNKIAIRMYLTDDPERFLSAFRGAVVLEYNDGTTENITLDNGFNTREVTGFWRGEEKENWYTQELSEFTNTRTVYYTNTHPRALRRGCYFRTDFDSKKTVEKAYLYASAKGLYVPYLNGRRITEDRFIPGSMEKVTEYQVYDVTGFIRNGSNVLAAETGSGWYNCESWGTLGINRPALMMCLEIHYADGSSQTVETNESWLCSVSPRIEDDIQYGERYDARLEIDGWNDKAAPTGNWQKAELATKDFEPFENQTYPAVRIQNEVTATNIGTLADGTVYYDFKYNSTGRAKIVLRNTKPGERVIIRYCEIIENGVPYVGTYGDVFFEQDTKADGISPYGVRNIDVYICKGAKEEVYMPEFAFTGFRYVYISGYSGEYELSTVIKVEMNTDLDVIGDIVTSHSGISRIWDAVKRSWRSNIFTGPIDCPTREKNFWNGDIQVFASTASWYTDTKAILSRWTVAGRKMHLGVYGWEDEEYILPLVLYRYYKNTEVVKEKYPVVKNLINKRCKNLSSGQLPAKGPTYGDHQAVKKVPDDFFVAAYYSYMYKCAAEMAQILGYTGDAITYAKEFEACRKTFNEKYYLEKQKDYSPKMQGGIVLPMAFGIADDKNMESLASTLNGYVIADGYHLTTGFMGNEYNLGILCDYGYTETAWKVMTNQEYPSMLNMIDSYGGGTVTESWKGYKTFNGSSMNHYSIGNTSRWFFEYAGGIKITSPGFEGVRIKPCFFEEMGDCKVTYRTGTGILSSEWVYTDKDGIFTWTVSVPKGTSARIMLPSGVEFAEGNAKAVYDITNATRTFTVKKQASHRRN